MQLVGKMIHKALSVFKSEWRRHLPHPVPHHAVPGRAPRPLPRAVRRTVRQGCHQQGGFIWCEDIFSLSILVKQMLTP